MFDWRRYLDLADDLLARFPDDEAAQRAARSRAYYAVLGVARDHLGARGVPIVQTGRAHQQVWATFAQAPRRVQRRIAQNGYRFKRCREMADYDADYKDLARDARFWAARARQLIQDIDSLN